MDDGRQVTINPRGFRSDHVAEDPDAELRGLLLLLDQQAAAPAVRRLRDWTLMALDPRPGETAVDVGSGTGEDAQALARAVGTQGRAVGVEPHPGMRAEAVRRAAAARSTATFVEGDATSLPFEDASVDVLRSERVWQHLGDPAAAAREVARVLSPTGRAAIVDTDWATVQQSHGDPDVIDRLRRASWSRMANPFSGRHLRRLLVEAGLAVDADMGSAALVFAPETLRRTGIMQQNLALAVADGAVTQAEADQHLNEVLEAADAGTLHVSVTMFCAVARRG